MKQLSFFIAALLFIPGLYSFGQVMISKDNSSPHSSAILDVKAIDAGMLIPRMSEAQRLAIPDPATGLIVYQFSGYDFDYDGFYYYDGTKWNRIGVNFGHYPGEKHAGGIVFWVDKTGKHGLIVSMIDLSIAQSWSNVSTTTIGTSAQSKWDGISNTNAIVNQVGHQSSAAQLCLNYVNAEYGTGIYDDWYLMSPGEAIHLMNNIYEVEKTLETDLNPATIPFSDGPYWTSGEFDADQACSCFGNLPSNCDTYKSATCFVRAIRAF